jgi:hypothetical protein
VAVVRRHVAIGSAAALGLFLVYLGIVALAQDWKHALQQTADLWYWIAALAAGVGIQAGLFSFIVRSLRERKAAATASMATSGGVSTGSMIACCAHHLADVLPFLGLSGLAAFLASYQVLFIAIGILSNLIGITVMLETIQRHDLSPRIARWWDMGRVKKGTMASAGLIAGVMVFVAVLGA